jgi:hypothetical protein
MVNLGAQVNGVSGQIPTGTVTFYDGSSALGTGALSTSGTATLNVSTLTPGTHNVTATYQGAGPYAGSGSPSVQEVILPGTFTVTLSPAAIALQSGQQGTVQIALTSVGGFSGPLTLTYGAMPIYASAAISPAAVTLAAGGSGSATMLLNTATARLEPPTFWGRSRSTAVLAAFGVLLLPFSLKRPGHLRSVLKMLFLAALFTGASGCGTIGFPFHRAALGTFQVPVVATDSNHNSQTAVLRVTITP